MQLKARAKTVIKISGLNGGLADLTIPKGNDIIGAMNTFLPLAGIDIEIKASVIGGWMDVNNDLPKESGAYWTFNGGDEKCSVIQQRVHMYDRNHKEFNSCTVTHWQSLPVPPK
jgi:hypothetical protein